VLAVRAKEEWTVNPLTSLMLGCLIVWGVFVSALHTHIMGLTPP
jgi:hypothetical protein